MSVVEGAGRQPGAGTTKAGPQAGVPIVTEPAQTGGVGQPASSALVGDSPFEWAAALYRSIVDTSPDAITVTTLDSKIILCNQQAATLHGLQRVDEMIARSAWEFVAGEDIERASRGFLRILTEGSIRDVEDSLLRADGRGVAGGVRGSAVISKEGRPRAVFRVV